MSRIQWNSCSASSTRCSLPSACAGAGHAARRAQRERAARRAQHERAARARAAWWAPQPEPGSDAALAGQGCPPKRLGCTTLFSAGPPARKTDMRGVLRHERSYGSPAAPWPKSARSTEGLLARALLNQGATLDTLQRAACSLSAGHAQQPRHIRLPFWLCTPSPPPRSHAPCLHEDSSRTSMSASPGPPAGRPPHLDSPVGKKDLKRAPSKLKQVRSWRDRISHDSMSPTLP